MVSVFILLCAVAARSIGSTVRVERVELVPSSAAPPAEHSVPVRREASKSSIVEPAVTRVEPADTKPGKGQPAAKPNGESEEKPNGESEEKPTGESEEKPTGESSTLESITKVVHGSGAEPLILLAVLGIWVVLSCCCCWRALLGAVCPVHLFRCAASFCPCLGLRTSEEDDLEGALASLEGDELALHGKLGDLQAERAALLEARYGQLQPEEVRGDANLAGLNAAIDQYVASRTSAGVEEARKMMARKEKLTEMFTERYEEFKSQAAAHATSAVDGLLQNVGGLREDLGAILESSLVTELQSCEDPVPVGVLCAGMAAPAQLCFLTWLNRAIFVLHLTLATVDAVVLLGAMRCHITGLAEEYGWVVVHLCVHCVGALFSLKVERDVHSQYKRVLVRSQGTPFDKSSLWSTLFQVDLENPRSLFVYDTVTSSWAYSLLIFTIFVDFLWNVVAVATIFNHANAPFDIHLCSGAKYLFFAMRLYAVLFSVFLVLNMLLLTLWIMQRMLASPSRRARLLRSARAFDAECSPVGLPIATLMLRAFVLRDAADLWLVELESAKAEGKILRKEKEGLVKQLSALDAEAQTLATRQERLRQRQKEYLEKDAGLTDAWLEGLDKTFGGEHQFAAQFRTTQEKATAAARKAAAEVGARAEAAAEQHDLRGRAQGVARAVEELGGQARHEFEARAPALRERVQEGVRAAGAQLEAALQPEHSSTQPAPGEAQPDAEKPADAEQ